MRGHKKVLIILLLGAAMIFITALTILIISVENETDTVEVSMVDNSVTYITKQVIDYPEDTNESPRIWQTVYCEDNSISIVYADEKERKRYNGGTIDKAVDFSPEDMEECEARADIAISNDDMGIIYSINMDQSLIYIANLIHSGYMLRRKVLTPDYAEVYLKAPEGNMIRILALPDKMLMAELDKDIILDDIDSYFN